MICNRGPSANRLFNGLKDSDQPKRYDSVATGTDYHTPVSNSEYNYSIRDLTGVDIQPTKTFPIDPANEAGFDNSAESLTISPALVVKYIDAARQVASHMLLTPTGIRFAPFPVVADTDRDKYCVQRIVDFYLRQPTDIEDYLFACWQLRQSNAGMPGRTEFELRCQPGCSSRVGEVKPEVPKAGLVCIE